MTDLEARKAKLVDSFEAAHRDLLALLSGLGPEEWERRTPTTDGWTIRDTVSHLAGAETGNQFIARAFLEGREIYRPDFDLARFNRRNIEKAATKSGPDNLAELEASRRETLDLLASLTEAELDRSGRRTTGDLSTVEGVFLQLIRHEREHSEEIRQALGR